MSQGLTPSASGQPLAVLLAAHGPCSLEDALLILHRLLPQVRALHTSGWVHRSISPETVALNESLSPVLAAPEPVCRLHGADVEHCPPELHGAPPLEVPADLEAARQVLRQAGSALDPRRIDVYQLGVLMCRLLTGASLSAYLHSPRTKARVPRLVQPLLERTLGFDPANRLVDLDDLAAELQAIGGPVEASVPHPTPSLGSAPTLPYIPAPDAGESGSKPLAPAVGAQGPTDLPFTRLGHYQILARIGGGGMGDVYLGYDEALRRHVAVKVLPAELARNEELVQRFQEEAAAVARLSHPNIVQVYYIGKDAGHHFFAMQYVEGESLDRLLARRGRLSVAETLAILEQCLAGLQAAHQAGLIHRDIKAGNILVEAGSQRALLADFGLVKTTGSGPGLTTTGVILGTADYIAPEQARGRKVDARSDLYSLGVVAYQMLSGRLPFQADTPSVMIFQHAYETPRPLSELVPEVPGPVLALVEKLMAKDPAARYQRCEEVLADLHRCRPRPSVTPGMSPAWVDLGGLPALPPGLDEVAPTGRWQRLRARVLDLVGSHAPHLVRKLQNTEQQVDGAVADYERRRSHLARLLDEATGAAEALAAQAQAQWEAAAAAAARAAAAPDQESARQALQEKEACQRSASDLNAQLAGHQEQTEQLRLLLAQADATLGRLRSQRDLLKARLRLAEAQLGGQGGRPPRRRLGRWLAAGALGLLLLAVLVVLSHHRDVAPDVVVPEPPSESPVNPVVTPPPSPAPHEEVHVAPPLTELAIPPPTPQPPPRNEVPGVQPQRLLGHSGWVTGVAFSPDGRKAVSGSMDTTLRLWDVATGQTLRVLKGHTDWVDSVAFSPDGAQVLSASQDHSVRIWDVKTGAEVLSLWGHTAAVNQAVFSPDGRFIATAAGGYERKAGQVVSQGGQPISLDCTVRLWDRRTGKELWRFEGFRDIVSKVAFTSDGQRLLSAGQDRTVFLLDLESGRPLRRFQLLWGPVTSLALSPDNHHVLTGSEAWNDLFLWNLPSGTGLMRIAGHRDRVRAVVYARDGRRALSGSQDRTVRLWDTATWQELSCLRGHTDSVNCVALSPDGRHALSGGQDNMVLLWDLFPLPAGAGTPRPQPAVPRPASGGTVLHPLCTLVGHTDWVLAVALSADNRRALSGSKDKTARQWDVPSGKLVRSFGDHRREFLVVALSPDGHWILSGSDGVNLDPGERFNLRLWDADSGQDRGLFQGHIPLVFCATFSTDSRQVLSGGQDGTVRLWDVASRQEVRLFQGHTLPVYAVALSPDGRRALSGSGDGTVRLWDVASGQLIRSFEGHTLSVLGVGFAADGRVLSGGMDRTIRVWDAASGKELRSFQVDTDRVLGLAFSRDGRRALVACQDSTIRLWDLQAGKEIALLEGHTDGAWCAVFSPDGRFAISGGKDNTVRIWRLPL